MEGCVLSRLAMTLFHGNLQTFISIGVQRLHARLGGAPGDQFLQGLRVIAVQVS
jgi:hypothetical protein